MLKINLLPPYIYEGAHRRNAIILWSVAVVAVVGCFLFWKITLDGQAQDWKSKTDRIQGDATRATSLKNEAARIRQESAAIQGKRDFVESARKYNSTTYPPVFNNIRDYTIRQVVYSSLQPSGNTVTLEAYAPTLAKVGHYMMWMEHDPAISNVSVAIGSIPGFPFHGTAQAQQLASGIRSPGGGHTFTVTLTLKKAIEGGPSYSAGGTQAAAGGAMGGSMAGGPMGSPGMMGGPMGSSGMRTAPMTSGGPMGSSGMRTAPMTSGGMASPMGGPGMSGPMGGGGGGNKGMPAGAMTDGREEK